MTGSKTKRTCKKFLHNLKLYFYISIELFLVLSQVRILNLLLPIFTTIDRKTLPNSTYYIKPGYNILIYSSNCFYHDIKWFLFNEVLWKITFSVHLIRATCERQMTFKAKNMKTASRMISYTCVSERKSRRHFLHRSKMGR